MSENSTHLAHQRDHRLSGELDESITSDNMHEHMHNGIKWPKLAVNQAFKEAFHGANLFANLLLQILSPGDKESRHELWRLHPPYRSRPGGRTRLCSWTLRSTPMKSAKISEVTRRGFESAKNQYVGIEWIPC